jgi:GT2 family glycosyltransferase
LTSTQLDNAPVHDVVVITVQYRNFHDTSELVRSLAHLEGASKIELVVVDNASDDPGSRRLAELAKSAPFRMRSLNPGKNLYYWGGAAFALDRLRAERETLPSWVMICNNDVSFPDEAFVTQLLALEPADYPVIAPEIVSVATGKSQNPILARAPGPLKRLKWRVYDIDYRIAQLMLRVHGAATRFRKPTARSRSAPGSTRTVYAPHGACVIFSSSFFEKGGELDTTVPMFAEELTLAAAAERLNLPVRYVSSLRIDHREHSTTGSGLTKEKYEMERSARRRYYLLTAP